MSNRPHLQQNLVPTEPYNSHASKNCTQPLILNETPPSTQLPVPTVKKYSSLPGLLLAVFFNVLLVINHQQGWILSQSASNLVKQNRASTQLVVQIVSNIFGVLKVTALCALINQATRLRLPQRSNSLAQIQFWADLCTLHPDWSLPSKFLVPLIGFIVLTIVPSALWAGAMSPISTQVDQIRTVILPGYANMSLIHEYPSEFGSVTTVRSSKGAFAYHVGILLEGDLLSSAATATTVDRTPRRHPKLDNSAFAYDGRSYGVGASVGLTDDGILGANDVDSYTYQEVGYDVQVNCINNDTSEFVLELDSDVIWEARGYLPNSNGNEERSTYIGRGNDSIVAIGVAYTQTKGTQYLAIAAGTNYHHLDKTQCSIDYIPTVFNVSVGIASRKITVTPSTQNTTIEDIDPSGNLSFVATRQLELISNDQTNLYQSLLGNSFLSSIGNYNISKANSSNELTERNSALAGVTNSVTAMLDDILVGYASAQMMVAGQNYTAEGIVTVDSVKVGQGIYIWAAMAFNLAVLLVFAEEVWRCRAWKGLIDFDYLDISKVIVTSSRGGPEISNMARRFESMEPECRTKRSGWQIGQSAADKKVGDMKVQFKRTAGALVMSTG